METETTPESTESESEEHAPNDDELIRELTDEPEPEADEEDEPIPSG
jgi:hypothetical protein